MEVGGDEPWAAHLGPNSGSGQLTPQGLGESDQVGLGPDVGGPPRQRLGGRVALKASREATLMIAPEPRLTMPGRAARVSRVAARTWTLIRSSTTSGSASTKGA